jgi:histidine triad (HIT) family protein
MALPTEVDCIFCKILQGAIPADIVYQDEQCLAFLDIHPLFPGHVLLSPREHFVTLADLPEPLAAYMMIKTQELTRAVEQAVGAEGTFVAVNNKVSQTVPHLHIHIVPRRRRDGLKGFFWPRHNYHDDLARETVREAIANEMRKLGRR